jgi:hypothetical protein
MERHKKVQNLHSSPHIDINKDNKMGRVKGEEKHRNTSFCCQQPQE